MAAAAIVKRSFIMRRIGHHVQPWAKHGTPRTGNRKCLSGRTIRHAAHGLSGVHPRPAATVPPDGVRRWIAGAPVAGGSCPWAVGWVDSDAAAPRPFRELFKRHRQAYYDHLQAVRDAGDWEGWIAFFLRGVVEVSEQATETARKILGLREEHRLIITERLGRAAGNGHRVLEHLYVHPIVSVNDVQNLIGTTYPAANSLVAKFAESGILQEITGHARHRRFMYQRYINLFHDDPAERGDD